MATNGVPASSASTATGPRKLKILMLHGFTQSGPLFRSKTRSLEKTLQKAFPPSSSKTSSTSTPYPGGVTLIYPTGPILLTAANVHIPNFTLTASNADGSERDAWAWWVKSPFNAASHPSVEEKDVEYSGLDRGLAIIRDTILEVGGIDGVIGFSQGGCFSLLVASLLEPTRPSAFSSSTKSISFPEGWEDLITFQQKHVGPLKFAVSYSGFYAPSVLYEALYEPKIRTPSLHFIGSLDTVVEESRPLGLVDRCEEATRRVVYHPGGHFVPLGKAMASVLVGFVRESVKEDVKVEEESVEDMDMPF